MPADRAIDGVAGDKGPGTILRRMVLEVFGERDDARRLLAIRELFTTDAVFNDTEASVSGHDAISAAARRILDRAPEFSFKIVDGPTVVADLARVTWRFGGAGDGPAVRGTDVALVQDGQITRLYTFLEPSAAP